MSRRYSLVLIVLLVAFLLISTSTIVLSQGPTRWRSPTGFNDPGGTWHDEPLAYDEEVWAAAYCDPHGQDTWSDFLVMTTPPVWCIGVRYWCHAPIRIWDTYAEIDIDLYYDSGWQDFYQGSYGQDLSFLPDWLEEYLSSPELVTAMRVRYLNGDPNPRLHEAFEFNFGRSPPTNVRNILDMLPTVAVAVLILLFGMVMTSDSLSGFLPGIILGAILIVVFVGLLSPLTSIIGLVP